MTIAFILFIFTLLVSVSVGLSRNDRIRESIVTCGSIIMMVLDVIFCVWAFGAVNGNNGYITCLMPESLPVEIFNMVIIAGEIFLFLLITVLSIKHGKVYCILLAKEKNKIQNWNYSFY